MVCGGFIFCCVEKVFGTTIRGYIGSTRKKGLICESNVPGEIKPLHTAWNGQISLIYSSAGAWIFWPISSLMDANSGA
jgi:hypothetical protein